MEQQNPVVAKEAVVGKAEEIKETGKDAAHNATMPSTTTTTTTVVPTPRTLNNFEDWIDSAAATSAAGEIRMRDDDETISKQNAFEKKTNNIR